MVHLFSSVFLIVINFLGPNKTKTIIKTAMSLDHRGSTPIHSVQNCTKVDIIDKALLEIDMYNYIIFFSSLQALFL